MCEDKGEQGVKEYRSFGPWTRRSTGGLCKSSKSARFFGSFGLTVMKGLHAVGSTDPQVFQKGQDREHLARGLPECRLDDQWTSWMRSGNTQTPISSRGQLGATPSRARRTTRLSPCTLWFSCCKQWSLQGLAGQYRDWQKLWLGSPWHYTLGHVLWWGAYRRVVILDLYNI